MKKLALLLLLGGCSTLVAPVGTSVVSLQKAAYEAKLAYQATLIVVVPYIERPRCGRATSPVICSDQNVVDTMRKAIIATDAATQAAENAALTTGPDTTIAAALVTVATQAVGGFKAAATALK